MTPPNERDAGRDAQPWAAVLLPRFAWLAERLPWFAAPVAFHAWPWIGRITVWSAAACSVAIVGHAWMGGLAWQRVTDAGVGESTGWEDLTPQSGKSSPTLFADEALADVPAAHVEMPLPRLTDGLSVAALALLRLANTPADNEASDADVGHGAFARPGREDAPNDAASSTATLRWAVYSAADRLAAIASGTRAEAALSGLRDRVRALGVVASPTLDDSAAAETVVTQWGQWISEAATRHAVSVDRFVVDDRSAPVDISGAESDPADTTESNEFAVRSRPAVRTDVEEAGATRSGLDPMRSSDAPSSFSPRPLQQRAARIAVRGAFEPLAAFIAALGAASPPLIVQAAQIMPDHGSNGSRLALHAVLVFVDADQPRLASGMAAAAGKGQHLHASASALDARAAPPVPASDAAVPANPFQRRGQAQTDIVVLATYAAGGQRAVLLARHVGGIASRGRSTPGSAASARTVGDREEVALARAGETFADVRVMAIEADRVTLRPLLGGGDLVVSLARRDSGSAP